MKVIKTTFPGWKQYPVYHVRNDEDYHEIGQWMRQNNCEEFLLSSGSNGYTFQVKTNHEWFVLRWT